MLILTGRVLLLFCAGLLLLLPEAGAASSDRFAGVRREMVRAIEADVLRTASHISKKSLAPRVMEVMGRVERHRFVPPAAETWAYANRPLPIGHGQTISQPYIVALMTDLADIRPGGRVLEIGTGSGYQAAVLAAMGAEVFTIEIIAPLAEEASRRLADLGYEQVHTRRGDGYYGWEEEAPFDAIVVTAAAGHIPPPLLRQLKPGGTMVIPVGGRFMVQHLVLVNKDSSGGLTTRQVLPVRFVPLTGGH
ncbi:MAG: protein-L-isoaspartate(D-aspartate) O-methyltransferase [Deltaproteobacteria bacterium]|nr:protein-L-isoaspartate(D-aspartate) O-methyltransferase [Deltaproteobacteria bacterium]